MGRVPRRARPRVGPLRHRAQSERGSFEGAGFITWNAASSAYDLYSLTSTSQEPGVFTGRWDNGNVIFDGYEYFAGQRFASRHSITDISANTLVYSVDMGCAPDKLKRAMTIQYERS
jgi:hypothetical protein